MKKYLLIFSLLAVVVGASVALITFVCEDDWCYVFPWQKPSVNVPDNWKTYSSDTVGFAMRYDPSLTLRETLPNDVQFYKWGPTQAGETEIYDGIIVAVRKIETEESVDSYISTQLELLKEVVTITVPPHDASLGRLPAKQFSVSALGDFTIIMTRVNAKTILEVSYMVPDPTNAGFQGIVDAMLATFEVVK